MKVVIRRINEKFVQTLNPGRLKCAEIAHDLNVFFASEGLNFIATVEVK